ncbi:ABC transporter permease [Chryseobacterium sp. A321]
MKNILLITKREYLTQVKKKSFILLTLFAPLILVAFGVLIGVMVNANKSNSKINVIDKSGVFQEYLKSNETVTYLFLDPSTEAQMKVLLKEAEDMDGLLILPAVSNESLENLEKDAVLLTNKKIGMDTKSKIQNDLENVIREQKIKDLGLSDAQIDNLDQGFNLKLQNVVDHNSQDSDLNFGVKYGLSMVLMYVIFMFIIIYGVRVMRSVLEEKNNRVVEIIISSVKPFDLMLGKIFGVTLVALTQFVVWITMSITAALILNTGFSALSENLPMGEAQSEALAKGMDLKLLAGEISHTLLSLNFPLIITVFILFFLLGYIFYSAMYAAIGSAVDNETETQQFTLFAILPLTIGMYGSVTILNNPEGPLSFWLSMIPFTSPVAMIARIPFGVPLWEIALSLVLLAISAVGMVFIASKIYKVGVLMYGNKATLKEIWKWIRS